MKEFAKIERAVHAIAPSVNVSIENNCVVLRGELDNWDDVVKCGRAAVSKKYLGVINDITLRGYEQKERLPKINDKLYDGRKPDVLIVGGGISGATIAHELSKWQLDVMLVEKGYDVAVGATSRNDGCVHVGIDLTPKLVKHDYLIKGNAMYDELCDDMDVKFERTGHIISFASSSFISGISFFFISCNFTLNVASFPAKFAEKYSSGNFTFISFSSSGFIPIIWSSNPGIKVLLPIVNS